jgi:hypothetical protein
MNWLQFIDSMVGRLAWPIVVLIVVFALRRHLGSLAERVLELSFGGATIKFGQLLFEGAEIIKESPEPPLPHPALPPRSGSEKAPYVVRDDEDSSWSNFSRFIQKGYRVAGVLTAYDGIETELEPIGAKLGVKARNGILMRMLLTRDLISPDIMDLYHTLRLARNAVANGQAFPNNAQVIEYIRQSAFLRGVLQTVQEKLKDNKINKKAPLRGLM